jgi:hypothetical protein
VSTDAARAEMASRLAELTGLQCWEWQILTFADDRLLLIGGGDMVYSHAAEATFHGVTFISCPTRMMHPRFRLAAEHEAISCGAAAAREPGALVIAIDSATINDFDRVSYLTARSVEVRLGLFRHTPVAG